MRDKHPPQDTLSLKWDNIYKGAATMKLDLSVSVPSIPEADKQETSLVSGTRELPDHPPKEWAERMRAKYGPMRRWENARKVLERRYLKLDPSGERMETPEEMLARVAYNIATAEGRYPGTVPVVVLQWAERFYAMMGRLDFLPNTPPRLGTPWPPPPRGTRSSCTAGRTVKSIFEAVK